MLSVLFQLTEDDTSYLPALKGLLHGRLNGKIVNGTVTTVSDVMMVARDKGCTHVATTSATLLNLLLGSPHKKATLDDYAGSIIKRELLGQEYEFLIVNPLEHLVTVPHGKFVFERYFAKFISPTSFLQIPDFTWALFHEEETDRWIDIAASATFMSVDIETGRPVDRVITCIGFTFVSFSRKRKEFTAQTLVVPFTSEYNVAFVDTLLQLEVPKVFQNGKYDNAYLLRYNIPSISWLGDTAHAFHSWYSELPKRLDFIVAYMLRDWEYWKAEINTADLMDYYRYNAKDAFTTALTWIALVIEMPDWAWENYYREFPLVFPCLDCEMRGLSRDEKVMEEEDKRFLQILETRLARIQTMVGNANFNPSSPKQTLALFDALGSGDIQSSTPAMRDRVAFRHPLNKLLMDEIEAFRKDRKLETSYLRDEELKPRDGDPPTKSWFGKILYALNPHGTDTSRLASKESAFWCGWQIQNIPRDRDDIQVKRGIVSDDGFYFGEGDYAQNESWGTAYLSGDAQFIRTIQDRSRDFHATNASNFFGLAYSEITASTQEKDGTWVHKTVNKVIRDLAKRTNHGANYNMSAPVLLATMGIQNVLRAKKLLKLPANWDLKRVCQYLLDRFDETFPVVRNQKDGWYAKCITDVKTTRKLVGPTGWTRYCFGDPEHNKRDLNRYVAHPPQALGAQQLNQAFLNVWYNIALPNPRDFKLCAQIHDSVLFQYRVGREDLARQVKAEMNIPIWVTDIYGEKRLLEVPVDLKGESNRWSDLKAMH